MKKPRANRKISQKLIPSPSMVVAMIALVVALSGSAYAAVTINGKNIKKGTITAKQVKDKSLTGTDVKDGSLTDADVKDGSLTGADVKDGTVGASDISSGVIPTVPGPAPIGTATSTTAFAVPLGYTAVPAMSISYTVPTGANKIVARFTSQCEVSSTVDDQSVRVKVLVDGTEAAPSGGTEFCGPGDDVAATNSGSAGKLAYLSGTYTGVIAATPGVHTVTVQASLFLLLTATFDNMSLVVESGS